jgi:hypothetical protein
MTPGGVSFSGICAPRLGRRHPEAVSYPTSPSFKPSRVRASVVSGSTRALARGAVRLARRFGSSRFLGGAPMNTAEAAVLPGTGKTAGSSLPNNRPEVQEVRDVGIISYQSREVFGRLERQGARPSRPCCLIVTRGTPVPLWSGVTRCCPAGTDQKSTSAPRKTMFCV